MEVQKFNLLFKRITTDEKAFEELYAFYARRIVFHLASKYGLELAEDVSHKFFYKLITGEIKYQYIEKPTS